MATFVDPSEKAVDRLVKKPPAQGIDVGEPNPSTPKPYESRHSMGEKEYGAGWMSKPQSSNTVAAGQTLPYGEGYKGGIQPAQGSTNLQLAATKPVAPTGVGSYGATGIGSAVASGDDNALRASLQKYKTNNDPTKLDSVMAGMKEEYNRAKDHPSILKKLAQKALGSYESFKPIDSTTTGNTPEATTPAAATPVAQQSNIQFPTSINQALAAPSLEQQSNIQFPTSINQNLAQQPATQQQPTSTLSLDEWSEQLNELLNMAKRGDLGFEDRRRVIDGNIEQYTRMLNDPAYLMQTTGGIKALTPEEEASAKNALRYYSAIRDSGYLIPDNILSQLPDQNAVAEYKIYKDRLAQQPATQQTLT